MSNLPISKYRPLGLSLIALTFALAACQPKASTEAAPSLAALDSSESALPPLPDVQPMVAGPAAPVRRAPAAAALPKVHTLGYASASAGDRYAWIDRANRINDTIGDAPPDYGFDYQDGVQPYGWESAGGYRTYAEPTDGGYRYYYYDQGANEPYLVRDPSYSYGYSGGRIVTVYDRDGRALDGDQAQQQADYASRYYDRGRAMRAAADRRQRRGVAASGWADQRQVISTQRAEWNRTQSNTPEWRTYRDDHAVQDQRLSDERTVRAQAARQFSTWQAQGFRGESPPMYDQQQGGHRDGNGYDPRQQAQVRQQQNQQLAQQQQAQRQQAQQQQAQQQVAQQQRTLQAGQQQATRDAQAKAHDLVLRQQRDVVARQQGAAQQAKQVQQRNAAAVAKAAQVSQQHADKVRAQQQRVAAQTERQRLARQSQVAAKQLRVAAGAERLRVAREKQVVAKQQVVQQRAAVQRQREVDRAKRVAVTRQNAANVAQARKDALQKAAAARHNAAKPVAPVAQPKPPQLPKTAVQQRPGSNPG